MTNGYAKHWRLVLIILGIIVVLSVLYLLRTVILPFALGLVLAYLLLPIVSWLEKKPPRRGKWLGFKRVFSTVVALLVLLGIVGMFTYFIVTTVINASIVLLQSAPDIFSRSVYQLQNWLTDIRMQLPAGIRGEIDATLIEAGAALGKSIRAGILQGISFVPRNFSAIFGFTALPFFLFYVLKDSEKMKRGISSALTPNAARHAENILNILEKVLGRYIRAQLMLGLIVAYFSFVGLLILKIPFAPVLAILAGLMELIPTLGPWIGGAIAVIVTLAIAPEKALWVVVLYLGIQLVENSFLVPRVQGAYMRIHPALMIFLLVIGAYVAGFWGLLLAGPLTATFVEIYKYVRQQYSSEKTG